MAVKRTSKYSVVRKGLDAIHYLDGQGASLLERFEIDNLTGTIERTKGSLSMQVKDIGEKSIVRELIQPLFNPSCGPNAIAMIVL